MRVIAQHCLSVKKKKNKTKTFASLKGGSTFPVTEELDRLTSTLLNCN